MVKLMEFKKIIEKQLVSSSSKVLQKLAAPSFGVVFDIDGVLMKDGHSIPNANKALNLLTDKDSNKAKYPFIFMTNNGGFTEVEKARKISKVINYQIDENSLMVAHTPIKSLVEKYKDSNVLIICSNHETTLKLAKNYGFKNFTSFQQYIEKRPFLCPSKYSTFWTKGEMVSKENQVVENEDSENQQAELPIKSILLLQEPSDWCECIQVICDILQSKDGILKKDSINFSNDQQVIELHVCNPDFVNASDFLIPRFAMGALLECIKLLYKTQTNGRELEYQLYGKPYPITYHYGKQLINDQVEKLGYSELPKRIYAIGDNPYSDIKGANNLEHEGWVSILVKTGCFKGETNHPEIPAKYVVDNVYDAVKLILKLENQQQQQQQQ